MQARVKGSDGVTYYAEVADGFTCDNKALAFPSRPTAAQVAALRTTMFPLPAGEEWVSLGCSLPVTPPGGGGDTPPIVIVPSVNFTGRTTFGALPSTDTRVMDLRFVIEGDYIRITEDRSTLTEGGRTAKYFVAGRWVDSIVGSVFHKATPLHVSKFYVDLSRPQRLWRGNPTTNAFQII